MLINNIYYKYKEGCIMKNLTVKKIEKIKQCLYICLCCFIVLLGASISFTVLIPEIKKDIEYQNSWQA